MNVRTPLAISARWEGRTLPVRRAWLRPEPEVGDMVRLQVDPGEDGWQSFRIVAKHSPRGGWNDETIELDVEPVADLV
jgi:hypothetical protein